MRPALLILITSDPRVSHRPAEAVRIAAGVGVWRKADVTLYLRGAAVLALAPDAEDLVDQETFTRYLPHLPEFGRPVYVESGAPFSHKVSEAIVPFEEINDVQLADLAANNTSVLRF